MPTPSITKDELKKMIENHENVQIVNVLAPQSYDLGFIAGSLRIPLNELEKRYTELDAKDKIITYCAGPSCMASRQAAEWLDKKGFDVQAYEGGLAEWNAAGFPMENKPPVATEQPSGLSGVAVDTTSRR